MDGETRALTRTKPGIFQPCGFGEDPDEAPFVKELSATYLVILGEKHGSCRPVGFGDDPELDVVPVAVNREEPKPFLQRELVFLPILRAAFAPIACRVTAKSRHDVFAEHALECVGRCYNAA